MFKEMVDVKLIITKLVKLDVVRDFVFPPSQLSFLCGTWSINKTEIIFLKKEKKWETLF